MLLGPVRKVQSKLNRYEHHRDTIRNETNITYEMGEGEPKGEGEPPSKKSRRGSPSGNQDFLSDEIAKKFGKEGWSHVKGQRWRHESMNMEVDVCEEDAAGGGDDDLVGKEATLYRAISARIKFLSADRADLQFCRKEASRKMSSPSKGDWAKPKRIGR